jgi:ATP-dependent Lhr-like helicase
LAIGGTQPFWVAAERRSLALLAYPAGTFTPDVVEPPARRAPAWTDAESAVAELVRARMGLVGPTTAATLAAELSLPEADIDAALARVELGGAILRGQFGVAPPEVTQWCDRRLLARIHRRTVDGLRKGIEPAPVADFIRFLLAWQHARPGAQLHGREGVKEVIAQLQGFEAAAGAWEKEILPARVTDYDPQWLDELCLGGEVAWGRLEARPDGSTIPSRAAALGVVLRRDLPWLLASREGIGDDDLSQKARDVLAFLRTAGASFLEDIATGVRRLRAEVEEGLWELVAAGRVTGDGFGGLRALLPSQGALSLVRQLEAPDRAAPGRRALGPAGSPAGQRGRSPRGARPPVRSALRGGVPRPPGARAAGPALAGAGAGLPAAGDARRAAGRAAGGQLRRGAVRGRRGRGSAARHQARAEERRGGAPVRL